MEGALYDSRALRQFVGIDLAQEPAPGETTICRFWYPLEAHQLDEQRFGRIGEYLAKQGLQMSRGTIINVPSSTNNLTKEQDPEMHQTENGNQWYFDMKDHIGVGLIN